VILVDMGPQGLTTSSAVLKAVEIHAGLTPFPGRERFTLGDVKPVPVVFHIGPLAVHTYGIGLAITFIFGLFYTNRRLRARGLPTAWMDRAFLWIVAAAIVGARVVHVVANFGQYYAAHPGQIVAVWNGGLSSYGGLLFAVPTGLWLARRHCREIYGLAGMDFIAPVLMACWSMGRILGPNFEISGGGLPTHAWYGLAYAGEVGPRIPVPIFQCLQSFGILVVLLILERWVQAKDGSPMRSGGEPRLTGLVFFAMVGIWDVARFFGEYAWLDVNPPFDAVEVTGVALAVVGFVGMAVVYVRWRRGGRGASEPASRVGSSEQAPVASG
jgi:phosphatidylglycerol:prolipoprotein diacylglycerol transferase